MSMIWTPSRRIWTPPSRQRGFICMPGGGLGIGKPSGGAGASIAYVAAASGAWTSNSVSLPGGWSVGNIAIVTAVNVVSTAAITVPAGWTQISTVASGLRITVGYRVLQSGDTTTGTWSGANNVCVSIYSGQNASPIGNVVGWNGVAATIEYTSLTCSVSGPSSWVISCGGKNNGSISTLGTPTGLTARASSNNNKLSDSNAAVNSQATLYGADNGTNQYRASIVFELKSG